MRHMKKGGGNWRSVCHFFIEGECPHFAWQQLLVTNGVPCSPGARAEDCRKLGSRDMKFFLAEQALTDENHLIKRTRA